MPEDLELIDTEIFFENENVVLIKAIYKLKYFNLEVTSVGVKDTKGDIERIIDLTQRAV